jgi:hypothetical protein
MDTSKLTWEHAPSGSVLTDASGVVRGYVRPYEVHPSLWMGTAILGPGIAEIPVRLLLSGERMGANLVNYPVTEGVFSLFDSREAAVQYVINTLTKHEEEGGEK